MCCGYGTTGAATMGYDCVIIPQASKMTGGDLLASEFCGRALVTSMLGALAGPGSVCCKLSYEMECIFLSPRPCAFNLTYVMLK